MFWYKNIWIITLIILLVIYILWKSKHRIIHSQPPPDLRGVHGDRSERGLLPRGLQASGALSLWGEGGVGLGPADLPGGLSQASQKPHELKVGLIKKKILIFFLELLFSRIVNF